MKHCYVCVRCGYETPYKSAMHNHLFKKKKPCPMLQNIIELTDDIKKHILQNYIYIIQKPVVTKQINTTINNYNTINNFISNMDILDKIKKYMEYKQVDLLNFEDKVESKYITKVKRLDSDSYKYGFSLSSDDFLEIINEISSVCNNDNLEDFNIMFDNKVNKVTLYDQGTWENMLINNGLKKIMQIVQDYYLNSYEKYLLRMIINPDTSLMKRQQCKELLTDYYAFISCFDIPSCVKDISSEEIVYNIKVDDVIDTYWKLYTMTRDNLKRSEINRTKKEVIDILKRNTIKNIEEMNKKVLDLFQVDESFKKNMLHVGANNVCYNDY